MEVSTTALEGVLIIEPQVHGDSRGFFMESWRREAYLAAGIPDMVQSNYSRSGRGVLRGLHFQYPEPQGKLVSVLQGTIWDVAVDIRAGSPGFGQWTATELSGENHRQFYVPEGFAHGFCVTSDYALVHYMCSRQFNVDYDAAVAWDDPAIGIEWPLLPASVSERDRGAPPLSEWPADKLPPYRS
ncbi:MAG: dTDP-4-dehydrorhamnose 3,5-epimerase [Gammaproteobacteria bacterium]|nr:dTDP-4-dehydrorhamnose 3,5-epimerase [Gammaproteobacteria bacterium]